MGASKQQPVQLQGHISGQANEEALSRPAHSLTLAQVAEELQTATVTGLTSEEAESRLTRYGSNDVGEEKGVKPLEILVAQVANAMTLVRSILYISSDAGWY